MHTVLVIEDEASLRNTLVQVLMLEDYHALSAETGAKGLTAARTHRPDAIICDIALPEMDGFDILRALMEDAQTAAIPVIFLTARAEKTNRERGISLGAAYYITKPFQIATLLDAVSDCIANHPARH